MQLIFVQIRSYVIGYTPKKQLNVNTEKTTVWKTGNRMAWQPSLTVATTHLCSVHCAVVNFSKVIYVGIQGSVALT